MRRGPVLHVMVGSRREEDGLSVVIQGLQAQDVDGNRSVSPIGLDRHRTPCGTVGAGLRFIVR
jgi:hypothetical protein